MITLKEIRKRQETPYAYEMPYYKNNVNDMGRRTSNGYSKSYYDIHGGSFYDDILAYIDQLPDSLQIWIMARIATAMESGKLAYVTNDAIFAYIDIAHFNYYGYFAE